MRRPLQDLPERVPKKFWPLGGCTHVNAADMAPVSEFESPKVNIAGYSHLFPPAATITTVKAINKNSSVNLVMDIFILGIIGEVR